MEPHALIQQSIYEHGRITQVQLLNGNDYAVRYADGHAEVVSDPRVGSNGPIISIELRDGPDQMLMTNFENLWSATIFAGPDRKRRDQEAILPARSVSEYA